MTLEEAKEYCTKNFGVTFGNGFECYMAVLRIRHRNNFLPEIGNDGNFRDSSEWAFIDMTEHIDTRCYGAVYYFGNRK